MYITRPSGPPCSNLMNHQINTVIQFSIIEPMNRRINDIFDIDIKYNMEPTVHWHWKNQIVCKGIRRGKNNQICARGWAIIKANNEYERTNKLFIMGWIRKDNRGNLLQKDSDSIATNLLKHSLVNLSKIGRKVLVQWIPAHCIQANLRYCVTPSNYGFYPRIHRW
jgi:hypothetical protein